MAKPRLAQSTQERATALCTDVVLRWGARETLQLLTDAIRKILDCLGLPSRVDCPASGSMLERKSGTLIFVQWLRREIGNPFPRSQPQQGSSDDFDFCSISSILGALRCELERRQFNNAEGQSM